MPLELYQRGRTWWVRGRIDAIEGAAYRRQSLKTDDAQEARRRVAAIETRALRAHYAGEDQATTFAEAVTLYRATPAMAGFLLRLLPALGPRPCAQISGAEVRALARQLYPDAAADTWARQVLCPVSAVINHAHDLGRCPAIRIKGFTRAERLAQDRARGKASRQPRRPADPAWLAAFRAAADARLSTLALFMFVTGARISEALALRPEDLDAAANEVRLPAAKGQPEQWIDIPPALAAELARLAPRRPRGQPPDAPVTLFGWVGRSAVYKPWRAACRRAGIPEIMPHAAGRHGFGTMAIAALGLDPASAAAAGRWSDPALMLRTYAHPGTPPAAVRAQVAARANPLQRTGRDGAKALKSEPE